MFQAPRSATLPPLRAPGRLIALAPLLGPSHSPSRQRCFDDAAVCLRVSQGLSDMASVSRRRRPCLHLQLHTRSNGRDALPQVAHAVAEVVLGHIRPRRRARACPPSDKDKAARWVRAVKKRASALSAKRRSEIAKTAALKRWKDRP
jgi:hypothetical protein